MTYEGRKKLSLYTSDASAGTAGTISEEKICEVLEQKSMHKKYAAETIGVRAATESAGKCRKVQKSALKGRKNTGKTQEKHKKNTVKTQEKYSKITGKLQDIVHSHAGNTTCMKRNASGLPNWHNCSSRVGGS